MDFLPSLSRMSQKALVKCAHGLSAKLQNPNNLLRRHLANLIIFSILIGFPSSLNWMNRLVVLSLWGHSLIHLWWGAYAVVNYGAWETFIIVTIFRWFFLGENENLAWIHPFSPFQFPLPLLVISPGGWVTLVRSTVQAVATLVSPRWMWKNVQPLPAAVPVPHDLSPWWLPHLRFASCPLLTALLPTGSLIPWAPSHLRVSASAPSSPQVASWAGPFLSPRFHFRCCLFREAFLNYLK